MKKQLIAIASVAMLAGVVTFSSCKKDDTTAPSLTIVGGNAQTQSLPTNAGNGTYVNPTATASDDVDGDISSSVQCAGTVNPNLAGDYTLTYTVSDAAGNTATEVVTVTIANDAQYIDGNYNVRDSVSTALIFNYTMNITVSTTENGKIFFHTGTDQSTSSTVGFADYQQNTNINAVVSGSSVTLPFQTATNIGNPATETHDFSGNGSVTSMTSPVAFRITYTDHNQTNSSTASGCIQYYTHQ